MGYEFTHLVPRAPLKVEINGLVYTAKTGTDLFKLYIRQVEARDELLKPGWEDLVWKAIHQAYPGYVRKVPKPLNPAQRAPSVVTMLSFVRFFAKRLGRLDLERSEVADKRRAICIECPRHRKIGGCAMCKAALKLLVKPPVHFADLAACGACGCYLPLKVWLPAHYLKDSVKEFPFPPNCWMHALESSQGPAAES